VDREHSNVAREAAAARCVERAKLGLALAEQGHEQLPVDLAHVLLRNRREPLGHFGNAAQDEAVVAVLELAPGGRVVREERIDEGPLLV